MVDVLVLDREQGPARASSCRFNIRGGGDAVRVHREQFRRHIRAVRFMQPCPVVSTAGSRSSLPAGKSQFLAGRVNGSKPR